MPKEGDHSNKRLLHVKDFGWGESICRRIIFYIIRIISFIVMADFFTLAMRFIHEFFMLNKNPHFKGFMNVKHA